MQLLLQPPLLLHHQVLPPPPRVFLRLIIRVKVHLRASLNWQMPMLLRRKQCLQQCVRRQTRLAYGSYSRCVRVLHVCVRLFVLLWMHMRKLNVGMHVAAVL
jgi:hypothetical protein